MFWPWSSFRCLPARCRARFRAPTHESSALRHLLARDRFPAELVEVLIDCGVHEHREDRRRGTVDRHRHRRVRRGQIEAGIEHLHVVERGDADATVADFAVDVRPCRWVVAVQGHAIECGRQPLGWHAFAQQLEARTGLERITFAGEHPRRIFILRLNAKTPAVYGNDPGTFSSSSHFNNSP